MNGYTGFSDLELIELAIQEDLKAVGIDTRLENQEFAVIFGTWDDGSPRLLGDYDILVFDAGLVRRARRGHRPESPSQPGAE